jgi:hypothetical protein
VAGQRSPVAPRAFDRERLNPAEALRPEQHSLVTGTRGGELELVEPAPELIKRHRDVQVAMRVHATVTRVGSSSAILAITHLPYLLVGSDGDP